MKKNILTIFAICLFVGATSAQENINNKRFIEVTGTNETEVTPDEITLLITLAESKDAGAIQKQEDELKKSLKDLGIDLANLTLNSADADYQRVRAFKKDVVITKSYQLKITNADMVGKVYDKLDKINAKDAYILKIENSKIQDLNKESRIKAIKAAKEKVDYLLAAVGQQAGQPIEIHEQEIFTPMYAATFKRAATADYSGGDSGDDISFKKIKIKTSVNVKYEIVNK